MKKVFKIIGYTLLSFIIFIGLYFFAAWGLSRMSTRVETDMDRSVSIFIYSNGVHTDIVVPLKTANMDWTQLFNMSNTKGQDTVAQYLAIGWGYKGFYLNTPTWGDLTFSTAFKAAFGLSTSAVHTTFYKTVEENGKCKRITISAKQYQGLVNYIKQSLLFDANSNTIFIKTDAVYGTNDAFYEAIGSYTMFHTCNTWSNNALKSCGQKAAIWTPFESGIFYHYQ